MAAPDERTAASRAAVVSLAGHLVLGVLMGVAALDSSGDDATGFWLLAGFAGLGILTAGVMWGSLQGGSSRTPALTSVVVVLILASCAAAVVAGTHVGISVVFFAAIMVGLNVIVLTRIPRHLQPGHP